MVRTPMSLPSLPSDQNENYDLLADVSHHGSSFFDFLNLDNGLPAASSHPNSLPPSTSAPAISDTTAVLHDPSASASSCQTATPFPSLQDLHHLEPVDSFCTVDPTEQPSKHVHRSYSSSPSPNLVSSTTQKPPSSKSLSNAKQQPTLISLNNNSSTTPKSIPRKASIPPNKIISKQRQPSTSPSSRAPARRKRHGVAPVNMSAPANRSFDGLGESEASEHSAATNRGMAKQRSPRSGLVVGEAYSLADETNGKDTHNSHTRRCRAKVNAKFQELLSILPTPPPKTGIKHKAQILDYTIRVFRDIHARKTLLEAELALSSRSQLNSWIENVIMKSRNLNQALTPYLSLICTKGGWKYSEAWVPMQTESQPNGSPAASTNGVSEESQALASSTVAVGASSRLRLGLSVIPSLGNTDDPDLKTKLEKFRDKSRAYTCRARVDVPGRVMCTMRPEWLPSLEDQEAFQRAIPAKAATLVVCFGVPIFVRGHIAAVAVFFDTEQRPYDAKCVDLADNLAGMLGNAYGANAFKRRQM